MAAAKILTPLRSRSKGAAACSPSFMGLACNSLAGLLHHGWQALEVRMTRRWKWLTLWARLLSSVRRRHGRTPSVMLPVVALHSPCAARVVYYGQAVALWVAVEHTLILGVARLLRIG